MENIGGKQGMAARVLIYVLHVPRSTREKGKREEATSSNVKRFYTSFSFYKTQIQEELANLKTVKGET